MSRTLAGVVPTPLRRKRRAYRVRANHHQQRSALHRSLPGQTKGLQHSDRESLGETPRANRSGASNPAPATSADSDNYRSVHHPTHGELTVSEFSVQRSDAGKLIAMHVGDDLSIRLPELQTAGYQWVVETMDPLIFALRASNYVSPRGAGAGAAGMRTFVMRAVQPGQTVLRLASRRPWESANAVAERFEITLSVA